MKSFLLILFLLLHILYACKKKSFKHIEVKGTVMDFFTNKPIMSSISLLGDDDNEKNAQPAIFLKKINTNYNGDFVIKANAIKSGNYYLKFHSLYFNDVKGWHESLGDIKSIKISDNTKKDFGQIFESTHTFYCMVTINHVSGLPYDFYITMPYDKSIWYHYPAGSTNKFVHYIEYTKEVYESNNHNYVFHYNLIGSSIGSSGGDVSVPIQNGRDTVYATINY